MPPLVPHVPLWQAPTVLNARLKEMMERNPDDDKFIVNVSAMEVCGCHCARPPACHRAHPPACHQGKFYRHKNETHPHTNMAKVGTIPSCPLCMTCPACQHAHPLHAITPPLYASHSWAIFPPDEKCSPHSLVRSIVLLSAAPSSSSLLPHRPPVCCPILP